MCRYHQMKLKSHFTKYVSWTTIQHTDWWNYQNVVFFVTNVKCEYAIIKNIGSSEYSVFLTYQLQLLNVLQYWYLIGLTRNWSWLVDIISPAPTSTPPPKKKFQNQIFLARYDPLGMYCIVSPLKFFVPPSFLVIE